MTPFISLGIKLQRFVYTLSRYGGNLMIVDKFSHFYHTLFNANKPSPSIMTPFLSLEIKLQRFVYTLSRYGGNLYDR